ncbi:MAG: KTSC domain-containing protein [Isosphaeraceae bacterium]
MDREAVESRLIAAVGYDPAGSVLEVELRGGRVYEYYDVPWSVYSELMSADSKGTYFNDFIRDLYAYTESGDPPDADAPESESDPQP